ncbi:MAG: ABC transporter substrate-binding protein [Gammaproteobacteria bacterium]|nr:ABC transporter substrate-binding protein [Gammaproteobacteria bacterium]MDH3464651.1 ABC transporter substrate-binding protein [Gammaproteobacteria bacterium]
MRKTPKSVFERKFGRRRFLGTTLAGVGAALTAGMPRISLADTKTVKIGMNIPMTGDYAPWGLPGLYGSEIVANNLNAAGGVKIGGDTYMIEMAAYDHGYDTEKSVQGFKKLVLEDDVKMVMMLGGSTVASIVPWAMRKKMLTTTLLPSDITPDTPYLVATCESHPLYNVTGVEWLAEKNPDLKTAVIITTNDIEYGKQSAATYKAAFEVAGIEVLDTNFHGFDVVDFAPIVSSLLAKKPDVFCMATDVYTTPIVEQLFHQGYKGKIVSCTLDGYQDVIAKTSKEFVEGLVFQFPDFDDPKLVGGKINFPDPGGFDASFNKDHAGEWSAVAWEYPSILLNWVEAAQAAGSIEPTAVLEAMKANDSPAHTFGPGKWWGAELWGLDNAVIGDWPVVAINDGRARIQEFRSVYTWCQTNVAELSKQMKDLDLRIA